MEYKYVCKADVEKNYDAKGCSVMELPLEADFEDIKASGLRFYRYNLKAGATVAPALNAEDIVLLIFNGKRACINYGGEVFDVTEPAFFVPNFEKVAYTVSAVEDAEFILGVFPMNDWDNANFKKWHKHLPFFTLYTNGVQYDQACKKPGTRSWSILQGMQLGHVTVGVVHAIGSGTDEKGHPEVHQWNYCLGNSDFDLDVEGETTAQKPGDFSFIYGGKDHKLLGKPGKEVFYVWVEYYTVSDLEHFWYASCHNETPAEAYAKYKK